ncbi:hypothetical protein SCACP_04670 [Sporomusa carbonis]
MRAEKQAQTNGQRAPHCYAYGRKYTESRQTHVQEAGGNADFSTDDGQLAPRDDNYRAVADKSVTHFINIRRR